ncbi:MAG: hypothetical protein E6R07_12990 [Nevskiaceae bacterium]|nr:MAG: hypothetical protein E6R07_12990 [Nevskiaceae bacterium]
MNKSHFLVAAVAVVMPCLAAWASAPSGRVLGTDGGVLIQHGVQTDMARSGSVIGVGDTIVTTDTGSAQWQMADESTFAMAPDSGLKINRYEMPSQGSHGAATYSLLQGAVHMVTGRIGGSVAAADGSARVRPVVDRGGFNPAYLIKVAALPAAPVVLKSAFASVAAQSADVAISQSSSQFGMIVNKGAVTACNGAGCAGASAGQAVMVPCATCKPVVVSPNTLAALSDLLSTTLAISVTNPPVRVEATTDPRTPAPSGPGCVGATAQVQAGACGPPPPVSPN